MSESMSAKASGRADEYRAQAMQACREGRYLDASRLAQLATYEQARSEALSMSEALRAQ